MCRWRRTCGGFLLGLVGWAMPLQAAFFETHHGNTIVGEMRDVLLVETLLGGLLMAPSQAVFSIEGERLAYTNGMVVRGRIVNETVMIDTRDGEMLPLAVTDLKAMRRGKDAVAVPTSQGNLFEIDTGEVIIGELLEAVPLRLSFGSTVQVPPRQLLTFAEGRFALQDGSLFQGQFLQERLNVVTPFGLLEIPTAALRTISTVQSAAKSVESVRQGQTVVPSTLLTALTSAKAASFINSLGMAFVLVPPGEFMMGSEDGDHDERPIHKVRISRSFYFGKYEVTQSQWQALMGTQPSHFTGDSTLPVEQVSWDDVQMFLHALNRRETNASYRLPTEAEWEYAARAGTVAAYSFGDETAQLGTVAWFGDNAAGRTHPVGQQQPNAWGLYDMHGNVWEWVQDWYSPYDVEALTDPQGAALSGYRVYRGGGWGTFAGNCRSSERNYEVPGERLPGLGFRVVREVR